MDNNINLISELYDIKRQNTDWEIKLEDSRDLTKNSDMFSEHPINGSAEELAKNNFDITFIPSLKLINNNNNNNMIVGQPIDVNTDLNPELRVKQLNGNELFVEKCDQKLLFSPNGQKSPKSGLSQVYDGIKNVEQYVERRKINGITWYYCLWNNCNYGSNKSNHLVRHIRGHTGERPYACDWPNCGKKFTDSWKRKDHILSHNKKLFSIHNKTLALDTNQQKSDNNLNQFVEMLNTNNSLCEPIDVEIDVKPESSLESKDVIKDEDSEHNINMFIPEVIVSEYDSNVNNLGNSDNCTQIQDDINAIQKFIERTTKDGKVWYLCKFSAECSYGSVKNQHLVRHLRSVHQFGVRPFQCEWPECGKSFTEAYKLKEHQLTHYRKLITTVGNNNKNSMNLIFDTKKNDNKMNNKIIISEDWVPPINGVNQSISCFNRMTFNVSDAQTTQLLTPKKVVMSIKSVEQFVERRKIDGITRYFCQWPNCSYSSNKSNHLVRHITSHTNERKEVCDFPGCGKKFTDVWKLRDHQICHNSILNSKLTLTPSATPVSTSLGLVSVSTDLSVPEIKDQSTFYTPNPHKILIESLRSPPLPLLPTLPFPENYDKTHVRHKSPTDIVMSIKNVEQYVERRKVNGITFYFCKWTGCNYGSNKSNHLVRHVRSHTGERPYGCDECDKKFTDSWKLKDHKSIHAKKLMEKTMTDQKIAFLNFLNNLSHNNSLNNEKPIDSVDSNSPELKTITFDESINNSVNNLVQKSGNSEENSYLNDSKDKNSIDMNCEQNMSQLDENNSNDVQEMDLLVPQVIIDESDESYVNFNCNQEESTSEIIVPNIEYPTNQLIGDSFPGVLSIKNVEQYVEKVAQSDGNWYVCKWTTGTDSICGFSSQKSSYITQHVYRHLGERPYKCQWNGCVAKFNKKQNLKLHMTCHTGEQTFRCDYPNCYYTAISAEALTTHQKKHCGEKTFQCQWSGCSAQFATGIELLRHSKAHSGVRLHSCHFPNCDYASKYRNKLQIHIRRHTNTKPFICQIESCGKSFIVKDKLKRHENTVHKDLIMDSVIQL